METTISEKIRKKIVRSFPANSSSSEPIHPKKIYNGFTFLEKIIIFFFIYLLIVCYRSFFDYKVSKFIEKPCLDECIIQIVESIPENLTYPAGSINFPSTFSAWQDLIDNAEHNISLGVFYWTLKNADVTPIHISSSWQGERIFDKFLKAGKSRRIKIRIAQNIPTSSSPQNNSWVLQQDANAEVVNVNFDHLLGGGVLHTKLWIVDNRNIYIGSANMDWRALTQVKETGLLVKNCSCLAKDALKIFEVYKYLGEHNSIPSPWPYEFQPDYTFDNPGILLNVPSKPTFYLSGSPPFSEYARTNDSDAIIKIINSAKKFVYIAVMDYFPRFLYSGKIEYWPLIDNELRKVALEKSIEVRLMASYWNHTRKDLAHWLKSLKDLSEGSYPRMSIRTRMFVVPYYSPEQEKIPFSRVSHNKYMVTDNIAYIGTSNWSGDYFTNTAGVGLILNETTSSIRQQLQALFERDWNSAYARPLEEFL